MASPFDIGFSAHRPQACAGSIEQDAVEKAGGLRGKAPAHLLQARGLSLSPAFERFCGPRRASRPIYRRLALPLVFHQHGHVGRFYAQTATKIQHTLAGLGREQQETICEASSCACSRPSRKAAVAVMSRLGALTRMAPSSQGEGAASIPFSLQGCNRLFARSLESIYPKDRRGDRVVGSKKSPASSVPISAISLRTSQSGLEVITAI